MSETHSILDHIANARKKVFGSPLLDKYSMEFIPAEEELWKFYIPELFAYYPRDLFFMADNLLQEDVLKQLQLLKKAYQPSVAIQDNILIKDKETNTVIAIYHGWPKKSR